MPLRRLLQACIPRPLQRGGSVAWALLALLVLVLVGSVTAIAQQAAEQEAGEPLAMEVPPLLSVDEEAWLRVTVRVRGARGPVRLFVEGLPPGALWDEAARSLTFRPDFIQGGRSYALTFTAQEEGQTARAHLVLQVNDTLRPPEPRVVAVETLPGSQRLTLEQPTDTWLDSPGYAGRTFQAVVTVPLEASADAPLPVVVRLHGVNRWPPTPEASPGRFLIEPSDPDTTYWWGYSEQLPQKPPVVGTVPPYTARRVLALLEWVLRTQPGVDPERVFVEGHSMGGAGALTLGLLHARHFAGVRAWHAQAVARTHRPWRLAQLSRLWGEPDRWMPDLDGLDVWSRLDMTRALKEEPEARAQHLFLVHGKDDSTIHFGAVVGRSTLTGASLYETLQAERIGHFAVWDESGHHTPDPWLGPRWWERGWNPAREAETLLRRDTAFPAFTGSSWDENPGDGQGNGLRLWHEDVGYAGDPQVPGDTGWNGEAAGMRNRALQWDVDGIVDTHERLELPLRVERGPGVEGWPVVDVTPRRVQRFHCLPGERIRWRFGGVGGTVTAARDGSVTVPGLQLGDGWTVLELEREQP
jgi:poly(3-hydroxybutyrate) depolymerase